MALPYVMPPVSPFDTITSQETNERIANIEALAAGTGLNDGVITNSKLSTASGELGGAWSDWTPTFTNLSGGTLTYAKYTRVGNTVTFRLLYTLAGANVSGSGVSFTLPINPASGISPFGRFPVGTTNYIDANAAWYNGFCSISAATGYITMDIIGTNGATTPLSATAPFTWASTDRIYAVGTYECS